MKRVLLLLSKIQQHAQSIDATSALEIDQLMAEIREAYEELAYYRNTKLATGKLGKDTVATKRVDEKPTIDADENADLKNDTNEHAADIGELVIDQTTAQEEEHVSTLPGQEEVANIQTASLIEEHGDTIDPLEEPLSEITLSTTEDKDDIFIVEEKLKRSLEDEFLSALGLKKGKHREARDIRNFIGINEKMQYVLDLFGGELSRYNAALEEINNQDNELDASKVLQKLIDTPEDQNEEAQKTLDLLKMAIKQLFT